MLMTTLKDKQEVLSQIKGKVFVVICYGCKEVNHSEAEHEAELLLAGLKENDAVTGVLTADYICNPEYFHARFDRYADQIAAADTLLVLSCGVGVQTVASLFPAKRVVPGCNTYRLPGFQGVTPLQHDCRQCGECFLNLTGGICPLTACSKSLVNGQCGGAKDGKCEVDPNMECGWERIQKRLAAIGRLDALKCPIQIRNYATEQDI